MMAPKGTTPRVRAARSRSFIAISTVMLAMSTAIASITLWSSYQDVSLIILIAVTFLVGAAIAISGAAFRLPSIAIMGLVVAAYFVFGVPLAIPDRALYGVLPSLEGVKELFFGAATSWRQLITISIPVGTYQSLLIPVFILILVTVAASLSLALRATLSELAVVGPIIIFVTGILFGSEKALWPFPVAFGLASSILFWLIWIRWYRRRESIRRVPAREVVDNDHPATKVVDGGFVGARTLLGAAIILAIAGGTGFTATQMFPPIHDRTVLRTTVVQPFDARNYPSPLTGFRAYEQPVMKDRAVFTVTGLPAGARLRIATLDSYDGVVYAVGQGSVNSASGAFTRVPMSVDQDGVKGKTATITVRVGDYDGVWLPTIGKLERVAFRGNDAKALLEGFYFNRNSDTAAVVGGLASGDEYSLTAVLPTQPDSSQLADLTPGNVELPPSTSVPDELATVLEGYVTGVSGPGNRLVAMLDGLRRNGYVSHGVSASEPASRSGHSADRITELLTAPQMIGDQEQYSVTAALMARQLGFPARVVFGFAPEVTPGSRTTVVTGGDVSAWIEVNTTEFGWVAIDPTPPLRPIPDAEPKDPTEFARPQSPVQPQPPLAEKSDTQLPPNSSQEQDPLDNPLLTIFLHVITGLGWTLLVLLIVASPFLTIIAAKWRRRRLRRRAPTALEKIAGGWAEFEDAVLDHGYVPGAAPTRLEVAQSVGGTQPFVLAAVADRAVFAPESPDEEQAQQLWTAVDDLRYALSYNLSRWQRLKANISLRSLGGYSVTSLFTREEGRR